MKIVYERYKCSKCKAELLLEKKYYGIPRCAKCDMDLVKIGEKNNIKY